MSVIRRGMHPAPAFHWTDRDELLAFVRDRAFATLFADRMVAYAPLIVDGDTCLLHLSRANPLANALPVRVTAVVLGPDAYVSPDWYAAEDQVPTWNYVAVELEGELAEADVRDIVIKQSAELEGRIAGKRPWTPDKMTPDVLEAKLRGIRGARLRIDALRGTRKLSQNKSAEDRSGVIRALAASKREADRAVAELASRLLR